MIALLAALPSGVSAASFPDLEAWLAFRREPVSGGSITERAERNRTEKGLRASAAREWRERYFSGSQASLTDLAGKHAGELLPDLQREFQDQTLAILGKAQSLGLREMAKVLAKNPVAWNLALSPPEEGAPVKGGFHRGSRSIYLNLTELTPAEWILIYLHESIHALDGDLKTATTIYNNEAYVKSLGALLAGSGALSAADHAAMNRWVRSGLDRGLVAEYRAWVLTLALYTEGKRDGLWPSVGWVDEILAQRAHHETIGAFTLRYLNGRFSSPADGIFQHPLLQACVAEQRAALSVETISFSEPLERIERLLGLR